MWWQNQKAVGSWALSTDWCLITSHHSMAQEEEARAGVLDGPELPELILNEKLEGMQPYQSQVCWDWKSPSKQKELEFPTMFQEPQGHSPLRTGSKVETPHLPYTAFESAWLNMPLLLGGRYPKVIPKGRGQSKSLMGFQILHACLLLPPPPIKLRCFVIMSHSQLWDGKKTQRIKSGLSWPASSMHYSLFTNNFIQA